MLGLRLWLDFANHKSCLGRFGFDRRVNFITDYMRFPGSAENLDFYLYRLQLVYNSHLFRNKILIDWDVERC